MDGVIPTEADWRSEPWCLDIPYAYKHFAGKSADEAFVLFKDNAILYQEDVMFMPAACFPFYAGVYMRYLMSEDSEGDADAANCCFSLVECRAAEITQHQGLMSAVNRTLQRLSEQQDWYAADVSIYGSFAERAEKARRQLGRPAAGT